MTDGRTPTADDLDRWTSATVRLAQLANVAIDSSLVNALTAAAVENLHALGELVVLAVDAALASARVTSREGRVAAHARLVELTGGVPQAVEPGGLG